MYFHHVRVSEPTVSMNRSRSRDERGFGLVEVMIVAAIVSIIALGIGTLVSDMFRAQAKTSQKGSLNSKRAELIAAINSPSAWEATVVHADNNTNMACLRAGAGTPCTEATDYGFNLYSEAPALIHNSLTATAGFRPDGSPCNEFSTGTPDARCPFRWTLTWRGDCLGAATTCFTPDIIVTGTFQYAPGAGQEAMGGAFNTAALSFTIRRGSEAIRNDAVIVSYLENDGSGEAGSCTNTWHTRQLNTVVSDPGNNLVNKSGAAVTPANQIELIAGTYNCRVSAPAFKNGGNKIRIRRTAGAAFATVESAIAMAALNGGSANPTVETTININGNMTFVIEHSCTHAPNHALATVAPPGDFPQGNDPNMSLGVPVPTSGSYNGTTYTTVTCQRTS